MADLTTARVVLTAQRTIKKAVFPLGAATKAVEGCMAVIDSANPGYVWSGKASATLKPIGRFTQTVDNTGGGSGAVGVGVELTREHFVEIWDSVTSTGAITIANLFETLYIASNHELTTVSSGNSAFGIMWGFSPQGYPNGVVVEPIF
jgi:hypothetical protein